METFLYIVFFVSCLVLVLSVLLQPGKTDAGALFTSGVSSAAMNPRGTASVLSKLTIFAATIFMLSALMLSLPALTGNVSVLQTQGDKNASTGAANSNSNANAANSNAATDSNTATNSEAKSDDAESDEKKADETAEPKTEEKSDAKDEKKSQSEEDSKADDKKASDEADDKKDDGDK